MVMIPHKTVGEYFNIPLPARLAKRVQKYPAVFLVMERRLPGRATVHHVINRALILNPQWSRHANRVSKRGGNCQQKTLPQVAEGMLRRPEVRTLNRWQVE